MSFEDIFCGLFFKGLAFKLNVMARIVKVIKVKDILFKKPSSGKINLNKTEKGIVNKTTDNAALLDVFFQNNPNKNTHNTPGVTKPEYSWIKENNLPIFVIVGVTSTARINAIAVTIRPVKINL